MNIYIFTGISGRIIEGKDGAVMNVMTALGILGGIVLIAVIVVVAVVAVTVAGAFNTIKDDEM